jgi:enamine deaminase RidA (YjgF/YER057c/UK114 family)
MSCPPRVRLVNPPGLAPAVGFSHAAIAGGWIFLGGQIGSDASGAVLHPGDIVAQFGQAIRNVVEALAAARCSPEDVVKLTYYVTDAAAYRASLRPIGAAYRQVFGRHYPATSLFEVKGLFEPDAMVEIEAIALAPGEAPP